MKSLVRIGMGLGLGMLTFGQASAQDAVVKYPENSWSYYNYSSTLEEGVFRGQAALTQAISQAHYNNSIAAINYQEAIRRALENSKLYVQTVYETREIRRDYFDRYGRKPPTSEQLRRASEARLPDRLSPEQYDVATGELYWPHILRQPQYDALREEISREMKLRTAANSGDGSPNHQKIRQLTDAMAIILKDNLETVTPQQYANARWFLMSVEFEAQQRLTDTKPGAAEPVDAPAPAPTDDAAGNA